MDMASYNCLHKQEITTGEYTIVPIRYEDRLAIMKWRNEQMYHLRQENILTENDQHTFKIPFFHPTKKRLPPKSCFHFCKTKNALATAA